MSARVFLAVLLFSCSVINSSTISLSTGAKFLALMLNLMGLVVLVDCFDDGGVGGNGDVGMLNDHNLCYLFYFGRAVKVLHRHLVQGGFVGGSSTTSNLYMASV
jgi:hypothetical protein